MSNTERSHHEVLPSRKKAPTSLTFLQDWKLATDLTSSWGSKGARSRKKKGCVCCADDWRNTSCTSSSETHEMHSSSPAPANFWGNAGTENLSLVTIERKCRWQRERKLRQLEARSRYYKLLHSCLTWKARRHSQQASGRAYNGLRIRRYSSSCPTSWGWWCHCRFRTCSRSFGHCSCCRKHYLLPKRCGRDCCTWTLH